MIAEIFIGCFLALLAFDGLAFSLSKINQALREKS